MKKRLIPFALVLTFNAFAMMEPNDSEVVTTSIAMSEAEIKLSELAEKKAQNTKVRDFAKTIIRDHSQSKRDALTLIDKTQMKEKTTENIQRLNETTDVQYNRLAKLKGKKFDEEYISVMIENHKAARYKYDQALVPYAKDKKLKSMLEETQKDIELHLSQAQKVEHSL